MKTLTEKRLATSLRRLQDVAGRKRQEHVFEQKLMSRSDGL